MSCHASHAYRAREALQSNSRVTVGSFIGSALPIEIHPITSPAIVNVHWILRSIVMSIVIVHGWSVLWLM